MSRPPRSEFKGGALVRQERRDLFEKLAAQRWKNPRGRFGERLIAFIFPNEARELIFKRSVRLSGIRFSDNPSELLSAFRGADAVSVPF